MNDTPATAIIGPTDKSRPTEPISAHKPREFGSSMMQAMPEQSSSRRFQGGRGRSGSDRFEVPSYSGPMESLLDIIRFGPELLGLPRTAVLLFIAERTIAYRKLADAPSLAQIVHGVYSRRETSVHWVRHGCGLKQSAVKDALASLVAIGVLEKRKRSDAKKGNLSSQYAIRWAALHSYFIEKSATKQPPRGRPTARGSSEPLQTGHSEDPLAATQLSPWPPNDQEQYLDYNSARETTLVWKSSSNRVPLNDSNISKADYSFASANTAEGSESAFDTLTLSEANNHKADYSDVSSKPDESAADVRSYPQARNPNLKPADPDSGQVREVLVEELSVESQEPPPIADLPALAVPTPADAKPWTADELQTVYACGSAYMEHDTPPDKFATNCELAADGHAAAEVIAYLKSKLAQKRYRPGGRFGPSSWNWFYAVLRERFSASERGHLPEQPAVAHVAHQATAEAMDRGYDALGSPVLANA